MNVEVQLFAVARQLAGVDTVQLELPDEATIADLRRRLADRCPLLAEIIPHAKFAVDDEYADDQTRLETDSRVACIPPVSGG